MEKAFEAHKMAGDFDGSFDAIVVGTGAGGGPAATVLAEAGLNVAIVEKGGYWKTEDFNADPAESVRRLWVNGGFMATKKGEVSFAMAECVGGSTVINMCVCWRTPPEALARWRDEAGLEGWTMESHNPFIDRAWETIGATQMTRTHINRSNNVFERGSIALGWKHMLMARNVRGCGNQGLCLYGCPIGAKQSSLVTWIPKALHAGATLYSGAPVDTVIVENGRVTGVKGKRIDPDSRQVAGTYTLRAPIVCLAGGVIQTPAVLLRSGLEGKHKQAGANFQVHGHTFVYGVMPEKINMQFGAPQSVGVMEFSDIYGNNGPGYLIEGLGFLPSGFATFVQGLGTEHQKGMEDFDHVAMADAITRDRTRGRITIEGDDGHAVPFYDPIASDRQMYIDSMKRIAECLLAAGAKEAVIPGCRNNPVRSMKDLDAAVASIHPNTTAEFIASAHLFSSARMAGSPEKGFCNSEGESWETQGLYVTDGSALPSNLGCNPQVTIMSASLRIADGIVKSRRAG